MVAVIGASAVDADVSIHTQQDWAELYAAQKVR
jgi:hypothetical protein